MSPPAPVRPEGAWSATGQFHPDSHYCTHCRGEIPPGSKLWFKRLLVLCTGCVSILFPQYRN